MPLRASGSETHHVRIGECDVRYLRVGTGPTVLLVHTLRTQLEYFFPLIDALGPGFDIVVPDLPGHGRSSAPYVEYTAQYFTDAIAQFIGTLNLDHVTFVGESIGGSIALALATPKRSRLAHVVALNPYDYGRGGGIRRSSGLANVLISLMLWPGVGSLVNAAGTKGILQKVLEGGVVDHTHLPTELVDELWTCGLLPGHGRAFLSLLRRWQTWLDARASYGSTGLPITLVYGDHDWSHEPDRTANRQLLSTASHISLEHSGHFSCLDRPARVAEIIRQAITLESRAS